MSNGSQADKGQDENKQSSATQDQAGAPGKGQPDANLVRSTWERLVAWLKSWWPLVQKWWNWWYVASLPVKLFLGALVSLIAGPGVITFFSGFGTYIYAWHYGFRIPSEGTPHIQATVGYISFSLLVTGSVMFLLVWLVFF